jgi:type II secretory pathway component PulF
MTIEYSYRAARTDGSLLTGRIEAGSRMQAGALLVERGLEPVSLDPSTEARSSRRTAGRRDLAVVFRGIATLVGAGVPLDAAIASAEGLAPRALRDCLRQGRDRLLRGDSLAQALDLEGGPPPVVIGMLRAGDRAGRLTVALEQVATHLEHEADLSSRLRHALAYPAVLASATLASILIIGTVVVPKFAALIGDLGQQLPPATRALLAVTALVTGYWPLLAAVTGLLVTIAVAWARRPEGRLQWHRLLLAAPGVGPVRHGLATARVCRALGGSLQAGAPLLAGFAAAAEAAGDSAVEQRLLAARERVTRGESVARALGAERVVTPTALRLIAVGEGSGQLAVMLGRAGDLASQETDRALGTLVGLIEPVLVVVLGGFVAFVAAALLQAIYSIRPGAA